MIVQICSVWDDKAQAFLLPFFSSNLAVAIRNFAGAASTPGQLIGDHPQDFALFHLGSFSDADGKMLLFDKPKHLAYGSSLREQEAGRVRQIA